MTNFDSQIVLNFIYFLRLYKGNQNRDHPFKYANSRRQKMATHLLLLWWTLMGHTCLLGCENCHLASNVARGRKRCQEGEFIMCNTHNRERCWQTEVRTEVNARLLNENVLVYFERHEYVNDGTSLDC